MSVVVRFAPSPTGVLHIGSVRTALFNWLFARHTGGKFLLRIEDTDRLRSTTENIDSIFRILEWLNIDWDEEPVIQSSRINRHRDVAYELVNLGMAYFCYCSVEELAAKKESCLLFGKPYKYDRSCRDLKERHENTPYVIRLKSDIDGSTILHDLVQGDIVVENSQLDDLVLLRSDGTPTYMLSVVVDDHDMGISHIIRGDDHLTNAFRQIQIYKACGWDIPKFAHIPLIYGPDGAKLSKRHGAASAQDYMDLGFLPEAISNYLLRLGWSHGNDEIISRKDAIKWFDLENVGRSPSRFDMSKLLNLNAHYIKERDPESLLKLAIPFADFSPNPEVIQRISNGISSLKERSKTLVELAESMAIYAKAPAEYMDDCLKYATSKHIHLLKMVVDIISDMENIDEESLSDAVKILAKNEEVKLIEIAQAIRGAVSGKLVSPSVFEVMAILGKQESIDRINRFINHFNVV